MSDIRFQKKLIQQTGIVILSLPDKYKDQDIREYLGPENLYYINCGSLRNPEEFYQEIDQALSSDTVLCLDHINRLTGKRFWEDLSRPVRFLLDREDFISSKEGCMRFSQIKLLLTCSEEEFADSRTDENLLQVALRKGAIKFHKE